MGLTLEQIIISSGDIEKIYRSPLQVTLWRAVALDASKQGSNPFYPDLASRTLANGRIREADVLTYVGEHGVAHVKAEAGRGTSLTDKEGLFGFGRWSYVAIPAGTSIPGDLLITRDHHIASKDCWHYSVSPDRDMPVMTYLKALDQLALNAGLMMIGRKHARR